MRLRFEAEAEAGLGLKPGLDMVDLISLLTHAHVEWAPVDGRT